VHPAATRCPHGNGDRDVDAVLDGLRGMPVPGWLVGEQGILPRSAERFARAAEDQRLNGPFSRREDRDLRRYVAGVPGQPGWVSRGGRPGLRIFPAWLGIRPASRSARRSRNSIWALVLRKSSAAHLARAS